MFGGVDLAEGNRGKGHFFGGIEHAHAHAGGEKTLEGDVELGLGEEVLVDGIDDALIGASTVEVGAGENAGGRCGGVVGGVVVAVGLREVVDGVAIGGDKAVKAPVAAENVAEKHFAGAGRDLVDGVVGAHEGIGAAVGDGGAEGGEIGVPEVVFGGVDVGLVAGGFGAAVDGVVLGSGDGAQVVGVVALDAFDECGSETGGKEGVFAVGFLPAAPARIAEDVDVWRPDGEAVEAVVHVVADSVVVLGAGFDGDDVADAADQGSVPGGGIANGLGKHGGESGARDAVEAFVPPVVGGDVEAGNGGGAIKGLRDFFFEGEAGDQVVDALNDGEGRIAERHGGGGFDLFRSGGRLLRFRFAGDLRGNCER